MDEMAARLEVAALTRSLLLSAWQEFAELQREKAQIERSKKRA